MFKRLSLELGGKNPNLIFADADFEIAVETAVRAAFTNQGQICLCGSRILVEQAIFDRFLEAFTKRVQAMRIGDPQDNVGDDADGDGGDETPPAAPVQPQPQAQSARPQPRPQPQNLSLF